jgi:hypothetical protein
MNTLSAPTRRIIEAGQADASAITRAPRNLADADVTAARRERIAVAQERGKTRLAEMMEARATIRKHKIITPCELLAQLQNTLSATVDMPGTLLSRYRGMLSELACAIDADMTEDETA